MFCIESTKHCLYMGMSQHQALGTDCSELLDFLKKTQCIKMITKHWKCHCYFGFLHVESRICLVRNSKVLRWRNEDTGICTNTKKLKDWRSGISRHVYI